jgi:hypothetical protein
MSKKKNDRLVNTAAAAAELPIIETPQPASPLTTPPLQMRLGPGCYAVKAAEVEIHVDGARLTGGNGIVEFDLAVETWLDIIVIWT